MKNIFRKSRRSGGRSQTPMSFKEKISVEKLSLGLLLIVTALLYMVGLSRSGYANEFYSAAAQAGSTNWWSFLWGASDAGNSITVDKPPAAVWIMALSVRIFGLSSWSILLPQAIMGVLTVWLLYACIRRSYGHWAGIFAGSALALTPIACLMFRFNNPDALLMLLLVACVYCVLRAIGTDNEADAVNADTGGIDIRKKNNKRTRWMAAAGVCMGFAFLTKQLQAFLILPAIGAAFLIASPTGWKRKVLDTLAAFGALIVSSGWWVLLTVLVPADKRPYIGGSQTNSFLELTFSYNGLGRITGSMQGAVIPGGGRASQIASGTAAAAIGAGPSSQASDIASGAAAMAQGMSSSMNKISSGKAGMWGQTGITRLFDGVWGTQWSWLFIAALAGIVIGLIYTGKESRTSLRRANVIVWGGWLLVTGLIFSFMGGTIHQYYTVALAPATAALAAIAVCELWNHRKKRSAQVTALSIFILTIIWSIVLFLRSSWMHGLIILVVVFTAAALAAGIGAVILSKRRSQNNSNSEDGPEINSNPEYRSEDHSNPEVSSQENFKAGDRSDNKAAICEKTALLAACIAVLILPAACSLYTASTGYHSSIVTAGPSVSGDSTMGGPGGKGMNGGPGRDGGFGMNGGPGRDGGSGMNGDSGMNSGNGMTGMPDGNGMQGGGPDGNSLNPGQDTTDSGQADGKNGNFGRNMNGGHMGGLLGGTNVSDEMTAALKEDSDSYRWVAAAVGSQTAASYQLASECPVMPIGGFNGSDPSPTLEQFKEWVSEGLIHYFIAGGDHGGTQIGGSNASQDITSWVEENFTAETIGNVTVYDLTS
ncbi:MAG: glycosyltransferase family 39 protein [Lachnospiraceae bacterium]|jgi:4-amino-4-deoxy-L-arabinose transferase-like glycosyltransferase|nr:glycosyltransferase family 39 protein [Lachnospiraceae bacterium]MEE3462332.1 glycosyltransferase family 39 protein [Lachnospiraceae bacterium]